ncbi:MAG: GNAT family N-acetyltransferase [Candidatus Hermodarchaeota archaeon]|nr:GNAT family N-acetyltransferase [Candidatus Hermodarchaeota archaeon]
MTSLDKITEIETMASRAWPAQHTQEYGGWLLRAAGGVTRRANSVLPLHDSAAETLEVALEYVQRFYQSHKLPVRFQMTKASHPTDLDSFLESKGLVIDMPTKMLTSPLDRMTLEEPEIAIVVFGSPWDDWNSAFGTLTGFDQSTLAIRSDIINRIPSKKACAAAIMDQKVIGIGLGVLDGDWLGLFALVTHENFRRQHVATSITQSLVSWGLSQGASQAYLQVQEDNVPAQKLYYALGFEDTYSYWYRVASEA